MNLGRVIGSVWATRRQEGLTGTTMHLVQPLTCEGQPNGAPIGCFDPLGAGVGELVLYVLQYEATLAYPDRHLVPVDAAVIAIVDELEDQSQRVLSSGDRGEAGA